MLNGIVYTALSKGYDEKPLHGYSEEGVMTEIRWCPEDITEKRERARWNRQHKILGVPREESLWSLYLDGSLTPSGPIAEHAEKWLEGHDMALFKHPHRTCAYQELDACVKRNKITPDEAQKARDFLLISGFPYDFGLWACGAVLRRTFANAIQGYVAPLWWVQTQMLPRDQIWLPFALWKVRGAVNRVYTIQADIFSNPYLTFRKHA